jgi:hypothetical protein
MQKITSSEELIVGKYYFCKPTNGLDPIILNVGSFENKKFLGNRIWCTEDNPQAFEKFTIVGPIEFPSFN